MTIVLSELINLILKDQLIFPLQANSTILPKFYSFEMYLLILLQALKLIVGSFCQLVYITYIVQNVYNLDFER